MAMTQAQGRAYIESGPFRNEPFLDFRREENVHKMRQALERVRTQLGREYDLIIGGRRLKAGNKFESMNPSRPSQVVGVFQKAGAEEVPLAMEAALRHSRAGGGPRSKSGRSCCCG